MGPAKTAYEDFLRYSTRWGTYVREMRSPLVISAREELLALGVATSVGTETSSKQLNLGQRTESDAFGCTGNSLVFYFQR